MNTNPPTPTANTSRQYRSAEDWQRLITACAQSSLSHRAFCHQHGLPVSGFYKWRKKLNASAKRNPAQATATVPSFVELAPPTIPSSIAPSLGPLMGPPAAPAETPAWDLELTLGAGRVLRLRVA